MLGWPGTGIAEWGGGGGEMTARTCYMCRHFENKSYVAGRYDRTDWISFKCNLGKWDRDCFVDEKDAAFVLAAPVVFAVECAEFDPAEAR